MKNQTPQLERAAIIHRAIEIRAGIQQIFSDAEHWNRVHAPNGVEAIDPDPDGELRRIVAGLDQMLAGELQ